MVVGDIDSGRKRGTAERIWEKQILRRCARLGKLHGATAWKVEGAMGRVTDST